MQGSILRALRNAARLSAAGLGLFAAACASEPAFVHDSLDRGSSDRLFTEAISHLADNYIEPIDLRAISVAGLNGLQGLDPTVSAIAGPGRGLTVRAGDAEPVSFEAPDARDAHSWATLLGSAVATARRGSEPLRAAAPDDVYTAVLTGITGTLDDFSRYEPPGKANESRARREGYGGIGVTIRDVENETVIQDVMPETPADRAGLRPGDVITHADGIALTTLEREDRADRLRGPIGVAVEVSIRRDGVDPFTVAVERAEIIPTTVYFEDDKGLPRFRVTAFSRNTAEALAAEIAKAEARTGGLPGIVLDLRGNPGGYLTQAIEVADMFLDNGVVVATRGRHPASSNNYRAHMGAVAKEKPLVLLIDGRSASASELLAAALVDAGRAAAVGSVTYGKGSIQNLEELANGGELIITWSRMHAPSGYLLDGLGVLPSVCTVGAFGGADAVIRDARRDPAAAASWRAYRQPNKPEAERLRRACPKSELGGDADIAVARRLLEDRGAYNAALSPKRNAADHAAVGWRPSRAG